LLQNDSFFTFIDLLGCIMHLAACLLVCFAIITIPPTPYVLVHNHK